LHKQITNKSKKPEICVVLNPAITKQLVRFKIWS